MNLPLDQKSLTIFTIGHSNVPARRIVELLQQQGVQVLVDVRSSPYSKHVSQFNREMFQSVLQKVGLEYTFAGDYLGGRPKDPTCYKNGQIPVGHADFLHLVDYPAVMTKEWYQKGIGRLLEIARAKPTAIMCSEEDPARCHRQHLISQTLLKQGVEVLHIRADGKLQNAWLIEEKPEQKPAEQMTLLGIALPKTEEEKGQTEPELVYEPIEDGLQFAFPDFLSGKMVPSPQKGRKKVAKKIRDQEQDEREQAEKERLLQWIEKNKDH